MLKNAERFFKVYSNLPINERNNPIIILDNKPITWNVAYTEIKNETDIGKKVLNSLMELDFI